MFGLRHDGVFHSVKARADLGEERQLVRRGRPTPPAAGRKHPDWLGEGTDELVELGTAIALKTETFRMN